jgi:hypothetical protein
MEAAEHPIEKPFHDFCPHVLNLKKSAEVTHPLQMRFFASWSCSNIPSAAKILRSEDPV